MSIILYLIVNFNTQSLFKSNNRKKATMAPSQDEDDKTGWRSLKETAIIIGIISGFQLSCMEHNPGRNIDGEEDYDLCL
jgi:hypothetical protein